MPAIFYFVLFFVGLVLIVKGSDWFIDATVFIAELLKIPHIVIGATLVSICTTLPETFVSATAALHRETDVALGNAVGSIAVNTGLILALLILFGRPAPEDRRDFFKKSVFLLGSVALLWFFGLSAGMITSAMGLALLGLLVVFLLMNVQTAFQKSRFKEQRRERVGRRRGALQLLKFFFGISFVIYGSDLLVENGTAIAELLGVPSIVIALTITAFGTSLPELVTTLSAISKGVHNIGVGNILGADILNIVQVLGISSVITPIPVSHDPSILRFSLPAVFLICLIAALAGIRKKKPFSKASGLLLVLVYGVYLMTSILREATPLIGPWVFS